MYKLYLKANIFIKSFQKSFFGEIFLFSKFIGVKGFPIESKMLFTNLQQKTKEGMTIYFVNFES